MYKIELNTEHFLRTGIFLFIDIIMYNCGPNLHVNLITQSDSQYHCDGQSTHSSYKSIIGLDKGLTAGLLIIFLS